MRLLILPFLVVGLLLGSGCGLIPKRVEFGQDKVQKFPTHTARQKEAERQAIKLAGEKAREAEAIAAQDLSDAAIPAGEAADLAEAVGRSVGPPAKPWKGDVAELSAKLDKLTAQYNVLLEKFQKENDVNAGKKIEGTGFLSVPYFVWVGGVLLVVFIVLTVAKVGLSILATMNPGVGIGLNVAKIGGRALSNSFSEVLKGGEGFKNWLKGSDKITPEVRDEILRQFKQSHQIEHSPQTQAVIQHLTRP